MSALDLPNLNELKGQQQALPLLQRIMDQGLGGRVYLFLGPEGVGKTTAALALASFWLCRTDGPVKPCGLCKSCLQIKDAYHPDLVIVEPLGDKKNISIKQARELRRSLNFAPLEGELRVVIMPRAERLGLEAANALLKTLEEPPKETVIILTSANSDALPSTVLSRCLKVNFNALPPTVLQEEIEKQHGLESDQARLLALMTGEYLAGGQALNPPELLQFRAQVLDRLNALEGAPTAALFDLAEDLAGRPEEIDLFLAVLAAWCRDLLVLSSGGGEGLVNQDMKKDLAEKVVSAPASKWAARLNAVFEARAAIDAHANPRLALEALLIGHLPGQTEVP